MLTLLVAVEAEEEGSTVSSTTCVGVIGSDSTAGAPAEDEAMAGEEFELCCLFIVGRKNAGTLAAALGELSGRSEFGGAAAAAIGSAARIGSFAAAGAFGDGIVSATG